MATVAPVDKSYILKLWSDLAGNPPARCLVIARVVATHGSTKLKQHVAEMIQSDAIPRDERSQALKLLQINPKLPNLQPLINEANAKPQPIRIDPEIGRLAIAIKLAAPFRFWCIGRELTRNEQGSGKVSREALRTVLAQYDYEITNDHFSRIIRDGEGVFWNTDRYQENLHLRSPRSLAPLFTEMAFGENPALVLTNPSGVRDMYISVSGSHEEFEASLYAGWMAHREAPTISKQVLSTLFGRGVDTLRRWEQTRLDSTLTVRKNYAQYHVQPNQWASVIPTHAQPYLANIVKDGRYTQVTAYRWRISNTYIPHGIRQHPYLGQARKVRRKVQAVIESFSCGSPASEQSGQPAYLQKPLKLYFEDPKRLKRYVQKIGCSERYLWRGLDRNGAGVFEATVSYGQTFSWERAKPKDEYRHFKKQAQKLKTYLDSVA